MWSDSPNRFRDGYERYRSENLPVDGLNRG